MDDCIRRADVVTAADAHFADGGFDGYQEYLNMLHRIDDIPAAKSQWIPVEERLPEPGLNVLILSWSKPKGTQTWITVGRYNVNRIAKPVRGYWTLYGGDAWNWVPSYWMPLPTPPKEEDQ